MEDDVRVNYEGYRPGMYVRVEIEDVPCEFVTNFDATYPVILGGLSNLEENVGLVQVCIMPSLNSMFGKINNFIRDNK